MKESSSEKAICVYSFLVLCLKSVVSCLQGPGHVPVRQDQDLLQGWTGGVPGEAQGGQISLGLHQDPKDGARVAAKSSLPKDPPVCHPAAKIRTRIPGAQVRALLPWSVAASDLTCSLSLVIYHWNCELKVFSLAKRICVRCT